jgi:hypothetical protein
MPTYNGWLMALMYWDKDGNCIATDEKEDVQGKKPLKLDGQAFPIMYQNSHGVPTGVVEVPVTVKALDLGLEFDTRIIAGSMGITVAKDPKKDPKKDMLTTVQPCLGWWMLEYGRKFL